MKRILPFIFAMIVGTSFAQIARFDGAVPNFSKKEIKREVSQSKLAKPYSTSCTDSLFYVFAKLKTANVIGMNNGAKSVNKIGQYYNAPQPLSVTGFSFYAYAISVPKVSVTAEIYLAGPDSLPAGSALASVTVDVDSTFGAGNDMDLIQNAVFSNPVKVTAPYVLVVSNSATADAIMIVTNNWTSNDGAGEYLAKVYNNNAWLNSKYVGVDGGSGTPVPLNADVLLVPQVVYDLSAVFMAAPTCMLPLNPVVKFADKSSNVMDDRMYSVDALLGQSQMARYWNFGDGSAVENGLSPIHTYSTSGAPYAATLTDSLFGWLGVCVADTSIAIDIMPEAGFNYSVSGNQVSFTDTSAGNPSSWYWSFGDGDTSTAQNPSHTYASADTFTVCLVVSNANCTSDTLCQEVIVTCVPPVASFTFSTDNVSYDAVFTNTSTGTQDKWMWNFGDGNKDSLNLNPTNTYSANGDYEVCLYLENLCGKDTICDSVKINCKNPIAAFTYTTSSLTANMLDASQYSVDFIWTFDDGDSSILSNPSHNYATDGKYEVCQYVTNACGADTICDSVQVTCVAPEAGFTSATDDWNVDFTDTSYYAYDWTWYFGDGNTSTAQNSSHSYSADGKYNVCLVAGSACGTDSICDTVEVKCLISAGFTSVLNGLNASFTNTSTGNITSLLWTFGDGSVDSVNSNPSHTYATKGSYAVKLYVYSACGVDSVVDTIKITCLHPVAAFTSSSINYAATFTDASTDPASWNWDFGDGNSSTSQSPSHTYSTTGTFNVCLIVSNGCGADTLCKNITITCPKPVASFNLVESGNPSYPANHWQATNTTDSTTYTSYLWEDGDGNSSGSIKNPNLEYSIAGGGSGPGTYTVCLTVTNACGSDKLCKQLTFTNVGISEISALSETKLYPSPAANNIYFDFNFDKRSDVSVSLFDVVGKNVMNVQFKNVMSSTEKINISELPTGVYIIKLSSGNNVVTKKVTITE